MQDLLLSIHKSFPTTVLMVTHDVEEAIFLADRVVVLSARPGTVVHEEVISLPRPRRRDMVTDPTFLEHREVLLRALGLLEESAP